MLLKTKIIIWLKEILDIKIGWWYNIRAVKFLNAITIELHIQKNRRGESYILSV